MKNMFVCRGCNGSKTVDEYSDGEVVGTRNCNACNGSGKMELGWLEDESNIFHSYQVLECLDLTEYNSLSDSQKSGVLLLLCCGLVDLNDGKFGKVRLLNWFGAESTTVSNLIELIG